METSPTCTVCNQNEARWLLFIGQLEPKQVHKTCGEEVLKSAQEGVKMVLLPSREMRYHGLIGKWESRHPSSVRKYLEGPMWGISPIAEILKSALRK